MKSLIERKLLYYLSCSDGREDEADVGAYKFSRRTLILLNCSVYIDY
jgi:hypothetical protein